jgi:hypothetical protein
LIHPPLRRSSPYARSDAGNERVLPGEGLRPRGVFVAASTIGGRTMQQLVVSCEAQ